MAENNYDKALDQALRAAWDLLKARNSAEVAFRSGAAATGEAEFTLPYLGGRARVLLEKEEVLRGSAPAGKRTAILILHYLHRASGAPLSGRSVGFKEVPQGDLYFPPFRNRVIRPLIALVERDPETFRECAERLGGRPLNLGDLSLRFQAFPYVPVQLIYHRGEPGIPSDLNLLFDASVHSYLATEDIVVLCEEVHRSLKSLWPPRAAGEAATGSRSAP